MAKKPRLATFMIVFVAVVIIFGAWHVFSRMDSGERPGADSAQTGGSFDKSRHSIDRPGSIWWITNKNRPLPEGYVPADLMTPDVPKRIAGDESQVSRTIAGPLENLISDASKAGHSLMLVSGYRSYGLQVSVYSRNVSELGQTEADRVSAKPGTSEHQTGLAADVGRPDQYCELEECFGETSEGKWVLDHAHEYGFIIRYLPGKESITGYSYEPWHLRYVGKDLAAELKRNGLTMEEFFKL